MRLRAFGVEAHPRSEHRGVYVGDAAICAIGLAVKRMTTLHGLALNACTALDYDRLITPCGTPQFGITSLSAQLGREVSWAEARDVLLDSLAGAFGVELERTRRRTGGTAAVSVEPRPGARMTTIDLIAPQPPPRKPEWLKVRLPSGENYEHVKDEVKRLDLHTVCQEAMCPNIGECWGAGTATIMILGDTCTRGCHFCNVKTGSPKGEVDWLEPKRVAAAVAELGWQYLVLTAVDRDDLADFGAAIFANTVRMIHKKSPGAKVECLTGDFAGNLAALDIVLDARPEVLAHNLETVERLQPTVRDRRAELPPVAERARARQALRQGDVHEDLADARPGRDRGRGRAGHGRRARDRGRHLHHGPVPAAHQTPPEGRGVRHPGEVRAPRGAGRHEGLRAGRRQPALAQLLPRGTSVRLTATER